MTTIPLERTDLSILEDLDWDHEPACEHDMHEKGWWGHSGPAWGLIERLHCPTCGYREDPRLIYVCKGAWEDGAPFYCPGCDHRNTREQTWRFIALVRP